MKTGEKIVKNASILFTAKLFSRLLNFLYVVYLAKFLGPKDFGIISFALALGLIFSIFSDLGLQPFSVREIARNKKLGQIYIGNIISIKIILSLAVLALIALLLNLLRYTDGTAQVIYLISLSIVINSFSNAFYAVFQANERMGYIGMGDMLNSILMCAGVFIAIFFKSGISVFGWIFLFVSIIIFLFNLAVLIYYFFVPKLSLDLRLWKKFFAEALPFGLVGIFAIIYFKIDSVMLGIMKGQSSVGYYNAAYRITDALTVLVPGVMFTSIYPAMSKYIGNREKLKKLYLMSFGFSGILGLLISSFTVFASHYIISIIFGRGYAQSEAALSILIWSFFFICVSSITSGLLSSINMQGTVTVIAGIGAALNISLNFLLIPTYGIKGAAIATVATECIMFFLYFYKVAGVLSLRVSDVKTMFGLSL